MEIFIFFLELDMTKARFYNYITVYSKEKQDDKVQVSPLRPERAGDPRAVPAVSADPHRKDPERRIFDRRRLVNQR